MRGIPGVNEKDWKLFRSRIPDWQEAYMDRLNHEYIELLSGEGNPSDKFWALEERIREDKRQRMYNFVRKQVAEGRQVYVVYPLIKESEKIDLKNLEEGYTQVCEAFPHCQVSMVHGKMKPAEKDAEMQRFLRRETQIMVATTVIEVGVDVPNATLMVIEDADRFGLSQLHQLRGRVGRGSAKS